MVSELSITLREASHSLSDAALGCEALLGAGAVGSSLLHLLHSGARPQQELGSAKRGFYIVFMFIYYLDAAFMFIYCLCLVQVDEQQTWRGV